MTIFEFPGLGEDVLDLVDDAARQLREAGQEARFVLMGPAAYKPFCKALAARNRRGVASFESYNHLQIVVDPFRTDTVCVLPGPETAADARGFRVPG